MNANPQGFEKGSRDYIPLEKQDGKTIFLMKERLDFEAGKITIKSSQLDEMRINHRSSDFLGNNNAPLHEQDDKVLYSMFTSLLKEGLGSPYEEDNKKKKSIERIQTPLVLKFPDDIPNIAALSKLNVVLRRAIDTVYARPKTLVDCGFNPEVDKKYYSLPGGVKLRGESNLFHEYRHCYKMNLITSQPAYIYMDLRYFIKDGSLNPKLVAAFSADWNSYMGSTLAPLYPSSGDLRVLLDPNPDTKAHVLTILSKKPVWNVLRTDLKALLQNDPSATVNLNSPLPDGRDQIPILDIFASAHLELFARNKPKKFNIIDPSKFK